MDGFSVADSDEVLFADVQNDQNIGGKVEINWQRNEFIKRKKIFGLNIWDMKNEENEDYRMFLWAVNEGCLELVKIQRLMDKVVKFVLCSCVLDVVHNGFQNMDA